MISDLFEAMTRGDLATVKAVLEGHPESVSSRGLMGMTPLHMAAIRCYERIGRLLIEHGADVNATKDDEWTPLHHASQNGHEVMVRLLLDHGADVHATSNTGQTALHVAAYGVSDSTITKLLAEPGRADRLLSSHEGVIRLLISRGANINATENTHGATPLHLATFRNHPGVVQVLLDSGADLSARSKGWTPLHIAAGRCNEEMVQAMLKKGADIAAIGMGGKTPREAIGMACEACDPGVKVRLEEMLSGRDEERAPSSKPTQASSPSEAAKVQCVQCGTAILPATAEKTGGKCMPCHNSRGASTGCLFVTMAVMGACGIVTGIALLLIQ